MSPIHENTIHHTSFSPTSLKSHTFDVICIGSGWAARLVASRAVKAGLTALMIESELMGGDCPFWACVPSKALLRPSEALEAAQNVGGTREQLNSSKVNVEAVLARRTAFTRNWDDEKLLVPAILETGAKIVRGVGKLIGEKKVIVSSAQGDTIPLSASHAVAICTGSVPIVPDIPGLKEANPWSPREATSSGKIPEQLVILGAGAVGCEMDTVYHSLGAKVTIISSSVEILPSVDPEAGEIVRKSLLARGVAIYTSTQATEVIREKGGRIKIKLSNGDSLAASEVLVATGRKARTEGCGLETVGLVVNDDPIEVDESLCVKGVPGKWLYAVGDVNGRSPLTHMCKYQARIASNYIVRHAKGFHSAASPSCPWDEVSATSDHDAIPQVIFTQPAVASVGLTRTKAEKMNHKVRIITVPVTTVGALLHSDAYGLEGGLAQWILDEKSDYLLGMTVVGHDVQELIHAATVAIVGRVPLSRLAHAVPCFPTMSEVFLNLADAAGL